MTVRVGIVGTGWVAQARHIPGFRSHPQVELASVFDRRPERASAVARKMGVPHWTSDLNEFLDVQLDVLSIATPPWTHAELAARALERGIHVFTEKPMAMNLSEGQGMVDAAESAGRLLCVSHNFLFSRSTRTARRFLGPDGGVQYALAAQLSSLRRRLPTWYRELPGGLLFDEMPHLLYLLQGFLGALSVEGIRVARSSLGSEPQGVEVWVAGDRGPGQLVMVLDAPVSEWQVLVVGSRGAVALDLFRDISVRVRPDGAHRPLDILRTSARAVADHVRGFATSGARFVSRRLFWGHDVLIRQFVEATLGRRPVPVTPDEALGVVRVSDRIVAELEKDPRL